MITRGREANITPDLLFLLFLARYRLIYLDVGPDEAADFIRRFLRHPSIRRQAQRMGKVVRVRRSGLTYWQVGEENEHMVGW